MVNVDSALRDGYVLRLNVIQYSQDYAANTSLVRTLLSIVKGPGSGKYMSGTANWNSTVSGVSRDGSIGGYDFRNYSSLQLGVYYYTTVAHSSDGTGSASLAWSFADNATYGELGNTSRVTNLTLSTIPRASVSTLTPTSVDAGTAVTINTNRASASFTHTLKYSIGATSGTIATGVGASTSWTPPLSLLNQMPSSTSGTVVITTETYSGATLIGTSSTNLTLKVPTSVVPTIGSVSATEATTSPNVASIVGAFVQNVSKLNLAIATSGTAGVYGSTITAYKISTPTQVINTRTGTTTNPVSGSGTIAVVGTVTDSRGRTASRTLNINVLAYVLPAINPSAFTVQRADSGGTANPNGTYIKATFNLAVASLINGTQRNGMTYAMYIRQRGTSSWGSPVATGSPAGVTLTAGTALAGTYSVGTSWEVQLLLGDALGASTARQSTVSTSDIFMHWATAGLGVGKYWERGSIDALGEIYHKDGVLVADSVHTHTAAQTTSGTFAAARLPTASETAMGISERATNAESLTGTDTTRYTSPANVKYVLDNKSDLAFATSAGRATIAATGLTTITFPSGRFSVEPRVTASVQSVTGGSVSVAYLAGTATATSFQCRIFTLAGVQVAGVVDWVAIQMTSSAANG